MKREDWKRIRHFPECAARHEADGWEHVELDTMLRLDHMRHEDGEAMGWWFIVLEAFRYPKPPPKAGHSFHGFKVDGELVGMAIDGVMVDKATKRPLPLLKQWAIAERWGWGGIGLYPFWERDGKPFPGLHLDDRPYSAFDRHPRWWRDAAGNYRGFYEFLELSGLWGDGHRIILDPPQADLVGELVAQRMADTVNPPTRRELAHLGGIAERLVEATRAW